MLGYHKDLVLSLEITTARASSDIGINKTNIPRDYGQLNASLSMVARFVLDSGGMCDNKASAGSERLNDCSQFIP